MAVKGASYELGQVLGDRLQHLFKEGLFNDITIFVTNVADDGEPKVVDKLSCHRLVLAAWSPKLKNRILTAEKDGHAAWFGLKNVEPDLLRHVLMSLYSEKIELNEERVWQIRKVAAELEISAVVKACDAFISANLSQHNCIDWISKARANDLDKLAHKCINVLAKSFNVCITQQAFLTLDARSLHDLMDFGHLHSASEYSLLVALCKWASHDVDARKEDMVGLLKKVRFKLMTLEEQTKAKVGMHGYVDFVDIVKQATTVHLATRGQDMPRDQILRPGIQLDVPIQEVRRAGWRMVYGEPYSTKTSTLDLEAIEGEYLLVAASKKGQMNIAMCAMGRREKIMERTEENGTNYENGVYWYFNPDKAFGFSPVPLVDLSLADQADVRAEERLSWHVHSKKGTVSDAGGFRAGAVKNLLDSKEWIKLVFTLSTDG